MCLCTWVCVKVARRKAIAESKSARLIRFEAGQGAYSRTMPTVLCFIEACLPVTCRSPAVSNWIHEIKHDG